jgi:predicted O-linked N-acetylglucosamine transferase (SPINDLY family)
VTKRGRNFVYRAAGFLQAAKGMTQLSIPQAYEMAARYQSQGQFPQSEAICNQILAREPDHAGALHLLGFMAYQAGRIPIAEHLVRQALKHSTGQAEIHCTMGLVLQAQNKIDEAIEQYRRAVELRPTYQEAINNLGNAYRIKGRLEEAETLLRQLIAMNPLCYPARTNLGVTLKAMGRLDDAIACYEEILAADPQRYETMNNLATALLEKGEIRRALTTLEKAASIRPRSLEIRTNLANTLRLEGRFEESIEQCRIMLEQKPNLIAARNTLAANFKDMGRLDEAVAAYRGALIYHDDATAQSNLLLSMTSRGDRPEAILTEARMYNDRHARRLLPAPPRFANTSDRDRPLRVGYVSADFRVHSVANFLLPLVEAHDPSAVQYACYSNYERSHTDPIKRRIAAGAFQWREILNVPDERVADWIREDQIDILVDLSGHTAGERLLVFARKPAPVLVTALGYPGTTGLTAIDWRFTDEWTDPPGKHDRFYSEKLYRLSPTAWCYDPPADAPEIQERPADAPIVFGSFNNHAKISPTTLGMWAEILRAAPSSKLLMKSGGLTEPLVQQEMRRTFQRMGIDPQRLDLRGNCPLRLEHLKMFSDMDIALDTYPYNGTTTTCEALWMGVPVVSLIGPDHLSRVGLSLLSNIGLGDLAAVDQDQYVRSAVELAGDRQRLAELRSSLRQRMRSSPLMDGPAYARQIERAYRQMWQAWCDSISAGSTLTVAL